MNKLTLSIAVLGLSTLPAFAGQQPVVIDPVTGVEMPISEIDMASLTLAQRAEVQAQLQALAAEREGEMLRHQHRHQHERTDNGAQAERGQGGAGPRR